LIEIFITLGEWLLNKIEKSHFIWISGEPGLWIQMASPHTEGIVLPEIRDSLSSGGTEGTLGGTEKT
jgi:hypothetical protein